MRALLHICNPHVHASSSRCFVPVVSLVLLAALLAASNLLYTTFPHPWRVFSSHLHTRSRRGEGGGCDIFRGDWVPDPDAPYYTNDTCSVIHEHYDCMSRALGFVTWRWRPDGDGCDLPRFDPARFLALMRSKTIAFVGDSLARNHKDSLICLLTRVAEPTTSWPSSKHTVYHYGEYNFTVASFWAPYLVRHEQIDDDGPAHTGLWNLHLDEAEDVWAARIPELDYVVVSASSWFYRPSMLYAPGRLVGCHYCHWVSGLAFGGRRRKEFAAAAERAAATGNARMMLMDTTEAMILRADAHPSKYRGWTPEKHFTLYNDCVHWCLPGAIDTWNDMLLHMLNST
uniref:Uncharacterized protein n=1 Tax=Aegilops tauschii TaxID=37682 RepID=N1QV08_AEGTA